MRAIVLATLVSMNLVAMAKSQQPVMLGRTESVKIVGSGLKVDAKMDTGAYMSSLHADKIEEYRKKGKEWIKFSYRDRLTGKVYTFDKPLVKNVRIKKRSGEIKGDGKLYMTRPVVKLTACLAGRKNIIEVNLTNRAHFKQKMLVGRKSMNRFSVIINPSKEFLSIPNCR